MFLGEIKLSKILSHNFDKGSDRLYQPLRTAIQTLSTAPNQPKKSSQTSSAFQNSQMKHSAINISKVQHNLILQSTFIPINKKLVQTNNPEKTLKARSNSYRTLSVQQRVGSPIPQQVFQQSISNAGKKFEIVYDYDAFNHPKMREQAKSYGTITSSTIPRTRSATCVGISSQSLVNRVDRIDTKFMKAQRKDSNTSIHFQIQKEQKQKQKQKGYKNNDQIGQYYEDCKKYVFNNQQNVKNSNTNLSTSNSQSKMMMKRSSFFQNQYKYNLFNLLDRPINTQCQSGLCHKNAIIAPKIKKRW